MAMSRKCKRCGFEGPLEEFATYRRDGKTRYLYTCKECHRIQERERQRKYVEAHREAHNTRSRENKRSRYHTDSEFQGRMRAESKEYYETNKETVLASRRRRYHEEKDQFRPRFVGAFTEDFEDLLDETLRADSETGGTP